MKFMKLGSKPDLFESEGNNVRFVSKTELATDLIVIIDEAKFYLHKYPLLSKSLRLHRLILEANAEGKEKLSLINFPGGPKSFETCAKFCYGMAVTLSAFNVVAVRCAAEYLEMTECAEKGNLIYKIDVFLSSTVFPSWRDSIVLLQTTASLWPWSEELKIDLRCVDSIASKACANPSRVHWSYTYNRKSIESGQIMEIRRRNSVPNDWWIDDLCELDVDLFKRVMSAIKSREEMAHGLIIESLKTYAMRWLPDSYEEDEITIRYKSLVQAILWLLPSDKASVCSCRLLLKLLKFAILIDAGNLLKEELMNRVSAQLEKASVKDLLIPLRLSGGMKYDVPLVLSLVKQFMARENGVPNANSSRESPADGLFLGDASLLNVGKLVDGYLAEIGRDHDVGTESFVGLAGALPEEARPTHDGLYAAIDAFLKEHGDLPKSERKMICSLMDLKKLTPEASIHAAQNDRLPLRVVVQVLFFEQMRAASIAGTLKSTTAGVINGSARLSGEIEEEWDEPATNLCKSLEKRLRFLKGDEDDQIKREARGGDAKDGKNRVAGVLLPSRSRRILDRFWTAGVKIQGGRNRRRSETSGSSQSPPTSATQAEASTAKSSGSSSRHRRHSVS